MDYFGWAARKAEPRPKRERVPDPPEPDHYEPSSRVEVSEGNLSDTFVGRLKRFWEAK